MDVCDPLQRDSHTAAALMEPALTRSGMNALIRCRELAEEYWEAVGVMAAIISALTVAIALAVGFNVMSTRFEGFR